MMVTWTRVGAMVMERSGWIWRILDIMEDRITVLQIFTFCSTIGRKYFLILLILGLVT